MKEIESLSLKLNSSKVILTVRKSKLSNIGTRFIKYEIRPLDEERIKKILQINGSMTVLGSTMHLVSKPYKDLANRPIFLTLLMILYEKIAICRFNPMKFIASQPI